MWFIMLTLRYMSDLHLVSNLEDRQKYQSIPIMENEDQQILILAGDLAENGKQLSFLLEVSQRFHAILYVFGNHEFYGGSFVMAVDKLRAELVSHNCTNVYILDQDEVRINNVVFLGATLWTDFDNENIVNMLSAKHDMSDYAYIRTGTKQQYWIRKLTPQDVLDKHKSDVEWLKMRFSYWHNLDSSIQMVVITHHSPSWLSVSPKFIGDKLNGCFVSHLDDLVDGYNIKYWFHGHLHSKSDYMMYDTNVLCNPAGYIRVNNKGQVTRELSQDQFDPYAIKVIE